MVMLAGAADGTAGVAPSVIPEPVLPPGTEIVEEIVDDDEKKDEEKKDVEKKDEEKKGDGDEDKEPKPEPEAKGPEKWISSPISSKAFWVCKKGIVVLLWDGWMEKLLCWQELQKKYIPPGLGGP